MRKEKTLNEIYELILDTIEKRGNYFSICDVICGLYAFNKITHEEQKKLKNICLKINQNT